MNTNNCCVDFQVVWRRNLVKSGRKKFPRRGSGINSHNSHIHDEVATQNGSMACTPCDPISTPVAYGNTAVPALANYVYPMLVRYSATSLLLLLSLYIPLIGILLL